MTRIERRGLSVVGLVTYLLVILAWAAILARWIPMPGAMAGANVAAPGVPEAMALSAGLVGVAFYLLMWGVMMTAMMFPSVAPTFREFYETRQGASAGARALHTVAFVATFTATWTLTGLVPLAANAVVPVARVAGSVPELFLGATLLAVGTYQLSRTKYRHLRHCRTALHRVDPAPGTAGAVRSGLAVAADSVGCCWALMALMVVVGSMNVLWMALVTVALSAEVLAPRGLAIARALGVVSGVAGVVLVLVGLLGG